MRIRIARSLVLIALTAMLALACGDAEEPAVEPMSAAPDFTGTVIYREVCGPCGATYTVYEPVERPGAERFQLRLKIENTGQRGRLDYSGVSIAAYGLDRAGAEAFVARFEAEQRRGTATPYLMAQRPRTYTFSHFLDARGRASTPPDLDPGETWQGWLVYSGQLPSDTRALVLHVQNIEADSSAGVRGFYGWISYAPGLPFIPLAGP
jgi:hypothetical protein